MTANDEAFADSLKYESRTEIRNAEYEDIVAKVRLLEQDVVRSFENLLQRIEALESKPGVECTSAPLMEKKPSTGSLLTLGSSPTRLRRLCKAETSTTPPNLVKAKTSNLTQMAMAVKDRNFQNFAERLNVFILDNIPFHREQSHFQCPTHKCIRIACFSYISICMFLFVVWGVVKLCTPMAPDGVVSNFVEIQHEVTSWSDGELQVPKSLCIGDLSEGLDVEAFHNTILRGTERKSTRLQLVTQDITIGSGLMRRARCSLQRLSIVGWFGQDIYKYISFNIRSSANTSVAFPTASIFMETPIGLTRTTILPFYSTFHNETWTGVELLLDKVKTIKGDLLGVSRMAPSKYEDWWGEEDTAISRFYTRSGNRWIVGDKISPQQIYATYYVRSSGLERDDTYQPYDIMRILMDSGGLWVALSIYAAFAMLLLSCVYTYAVKTCFRTARTSLNDVHAATAENDEAYPMHTNQQQRCSTSFNDVHAPIAENDEDSLVHTSRQQRLQVEL